MKVGIPREVKDHEYRVAITRPVCTSSPGTPHRLCREGGRSRFFDPDQDYISAGAEIIGTADDVWAERDLICKVKEPIPSEYGRMRRGQLLFAYLHLAASAACTKAILDSGITAVA